MSNSVPFNYIITIHNKEDLIEKVITCILVCCRDNSHIYPVLDGCTDQSEEIVDNLIKTFSHVPITKVYTPDVHEILAINAGLKAANQTGNGYNIILQDDVLIQDFMFEQKVTQLYEWAGSKLGFVSFRHGVNFAEDAAVSEEVEPFIEHVENAHGHGLPQAKILLPGQLAYRTIAIKSPVCIPFSLVRSVGMLEERLAPYMCDDIEYSIRCIKAGYHNAVFALRFQSDITWGSTRTKPDSRLHELAKRNINLIREWHGSKMIELCANDQSDNIVEVPNIANEDDKIIAFKTWEDNKAKLETFFYKQNNYSSFEKIKRIAKKLYHSVNM